MPKITQINYFDFFSILEMILSVRSTLINAWPVNVEVLLLLSANSSQG